MNPKYSPSAQASGFGGGRSLSVNNDILRRVGRYFALIFWVLVVIIFIVTGVYTVPADSEAVVQKFGKFEGIEGPGLHYKMPFGMEKVTTVPIRRQLKLEFGFSTPNASNPFQGDQQAQPTMDMVTGDLNECLVMWVIQYRISDPRQYLFEVQDPEDTLRALSEAVMREVIGDRTIDEVITYGRQEIETATLMRLQPLAKAYSLGVSVDLVQLKDINPPKAVQASFNDVNSAQQEKQQEINQAEGDYNKFIPKAKGEADRKVSEAEGLAQKRLNEAKGDADYFNQFLAQYSKAPDITRRRLYLETMGEVLPKMGRKVIIDENLSKLLPLLPLGDMNGK